MGTGDGDADDGLQGAAEVAAAAGSAVNAVASVAVCGVWTRSVDGASRP